MTAYLIAMAIVALIYMLLTIGLNLQYGYTGLANFGHVGSFAIGAYITALITTNGGFAYVSLPASVLGAALVAWPVALLSKRLRTDYFAIATLAASETLRLAIIEEDWITNGVHGITSIPNMSVALGLDVDPNILILTLLIAANLLAVALITRMVKSPFGRTIEAIRDDEDAVRALGKEPATFKVKVFVIGAGLAGLAGAFYAHYFSYISPEQFLPLITFYVWMAMILGGTGSILGAVAGSLVLVLFLEGSRFVRDILPGVTEVEMASVRLFVVGMALVLLTLLRPQGLMGDFRKR
ncbi:branched-chain amino acid ABC transporter permease [Acuticoccus sp. M5D2P5]|uniref:branched-chain amino acid ABC transporter permease n=1 Tax=Acuticoccus kalidii TaxID=2910977 RepID=UPI001F33B6CD|nr:branched-chain amino acid ABC transporter permease [Acuticoccus kalidii]MCF3932110.1 branched-chain amino acid ABC transporter permease [Acuticoccus kalidii]